MQCFKNTGSKKYRLVAGTFLLFVACNTPSKENINDMTIKTTAIKFSLQGKWKLNPATAGNKYPLPEFIIFKEKNIYTVEGKEGQFHPLLDGGSYEYDTTKKELRINTSNDAVKKFILKEKKDEFLMYENEQMIAGYKRQAGL